MVHYLVLDDAEQQKLFSYFQVNRMKDLKIYLLKMASNEAQQTEQSDE